MIFTDNKKKVEHTKEMNARWMKTWTDRLALVDQVDLNRVLATKGPSTPSEQRQFAPEYSQSSYLKMLADDVAITNYTATKNSLGISQRDRYQMIDLILILWEKKGYK